MPASIEISSAVYPYARRNLFFAAFTAAFLFTGVGVFMGWSSPALIKLQDRNFTADQTTMIVSLPGLAPGPLITMFGIDLIGRKYSLALISSTIIACWSIVCFTQEVTALLIARYIGGWGMGAAFSTIGIYISEISDVGMRASLNSSSGVFLAIGLIIVTAIGPYISFDWLTVLCLVVPSIFALLFWFLPESPYYLVKIGQMDRARASLLWLRREATDKNIDYELSQIQYCIEEERKQKVGIRKLFTSKAVFKQFTVAWFLLFLQQATGLNPVIAYAQSIFMQAGLPIDAALIPTGINIISLFAGISSPFFVKRFGNRGCMPFSTILCGVSHLLTATYFLLKEQGVDVSSFSWVPVLAICFAMSVVHIGLAGLVWAMVADLFAPSVKGYASGISGLFSTLLGFLANTLFGILQEKIGLGSTFMGFGMTLLVSSIGLFFIPDITSMSLQEVQDHFEGKTIDKKKKEKIIYSIS